MTVTRRVLGFASALSAAGLASGWPTIVEACTCTTAVVHTWPEEGATEVPTNARIWIGTEKFEIGDEGDDLDALLKLLGPDDAEVAFARTTIDTMTWSFEEEGAYTYNDLWVLTPDEPLAPGDYRVVFDEGHVLLDFTVGAAADDEAPPAPEVVAVDYDVAGERSYCGESRTIWLELAAPFELIVVEQEGGPSLDPYALAGGVADAITPEHGQHVGFGRGPCINNWDAELGATTRVRLGAYDLAGNFSGWSPWIDLEMRRAGCECSAAPDDPRRPLALLLLGALLLGRRRRRRSGVRV